MKLRHIFFTAYFILSSYICYNIVFDGITFYTTEIIIAHIIVVIAFSVMLSSVVLFITWIVLLIFNIDIFSDH